MIFFRNFVLKNGTSFLNLRVPFNIGITTLSLINLKKRRVFSGQKVMFDYNYSKYLEIHILSENFGLSINNDKQETKFSKNNLFWTKTI